MPTFSRICLIRKVVVVLPFVPVKPISFNLSAGLPKKFAHIGEYTALEFSTIICLSIPRSCSTTTAAAPLSSISFATEWPSNAAPLMHINSDPSFTRRESCVTSKTSTSSNSF